MWWFISRFTDAFFFFFASVVVAWRGPWSQGGGT
jgi:hypothetical protein